MHCSCMATDFPSQISVQDVLLWVSGLALSGFHGSYIASSASTPRHLSVQHCTFHWIHMGMQYLVMALFRDPLVTGGPAVR